MQVQHFPYYHYPQTMMLQNEYRNAYGNEYGPEYWNDERFFPFFPLLAPVAFVAGLAIGPLLFNNRPPVYAPYPPHFHPLTLLILLTLLIKVFRATSNNNSAHRLEYPKISIYTLDKDWTEGVIKRLLFLSLKGIRLNFTSLYILKWYNMKCIDGKVLGNDCHSLDMYMH